MEKTIDYYMNLPYTIELQRDMEEGWFVRVKELRGCTSQGDTAEEAIAMIQEAMSLWLEVALEEGLPIPEPRPDENYSGKFVVRVPRSLHRELVETAEQEGVSLNQYINVALAHSVGRPLGVPLPAKAEKLAWPGIEPAVRQALTAAGLAKEAGEMDERLFASWAREILVQVGSALQEGSLREVLSHLATLAEGLRAGADKSPVFAAFYQMLHLLDQQIESQAKRQQVGIDSIALYSRITQFAEGTNKAFAQPMLQEERVTYSATTAGEMRLRRSQPIPQRSEPERW
jgi:antitoxin HicB